MDGLHDIQSDGSSHGPRIELREDHPVFEKLVDPVDVTPVGDEEAASLRKAIDVLLLRLSARAKRSTRARNRRCLRQLMPRFVWSRRPMEASSFTVCSAIAEAGRQSGRRGRCRLRSLDLPSFPATVNDRFGERAMSEHRETVAVGRPPRPVRSGMVGLKPLFKPFERSKLDTRESANAAIFLAVSRLPDPAFPTVSHPVRKHPPGREEPRLWGECSRSSGNRIRHFRSGSIPIANAPRISRTRR